MNKKGKDVVKKHRKAVARVKAKAAAGKAAGKTARTAKRAPAAKA